MPDEHPTPKGSGKDSKGKGKLKGSGKSAAPEEHPHPKPSSKQSKGTGELKGSDKSAGAEEHPKGSGKQSGSPDQKVELRDLNPESMRKFFDSETYAKGSGNKDEPKESTKSAGAVRQERRTCRGAPQPQGIR